MKFIVKLFPEISIKSKPVRKQLVSRLRDNIGKILAQVSPDIKVVSQWDRIDVDLAKAVSSMEVPEEQKTSQTVSQTVSQKACQKEPSGLIGLVADMLQRIPGIANILLVEQHDLVDFDQVTNLAIDYYAQEIAGKSFVVRVRRAGRHSFTSTQMEQYVGGGLLAHTSADRVDLRNPEVTINIEVRGNDLFLVKKRYEGLGGFPLGSQEPVLSLISGGFDSVAASYLTMRRGLKTHFCFFNLGGDAHEIGVKQVALYLWERYGASHRVKFVSVPFEEVVAEILKSVHHSQMGVVLKRLMLRAASEVAKELKLHALVTGESVAQVSSQTLPNLAVIDRATDTLVLRPLITMDKLDIIRLCAQIGAEEFAANMPEYCGVISDRPTTRARLGKVLAEEEKFDFAVLDKALAERKMISVDEVMESTVVAGVVEVVSTPAIGDVIVDIRHPDERQKSPLKLTNNRIIHLPFYELASKASEFDPDKRYLLYCKKGTMSRLHASHLNRLGQNVLVYRQG
ncbi:MAG: tRNA 4-thiouridine(8) synthase ThiI [Proteobacteria bacterium]|nr:MAG: tRNA 4-thiouridine(8) synthase ThiI [Pseudomonadota bacterium]